MVTPAMRTTAVLLVTPAMRRTAVLLGFLNLTKIIITLRRAQKFGDMGPKKNFDFLCNPLLHELFCNFS